MLARQTTTFLIVLAGIHCLTGANPLYSDRFAYSHLFWQGDSSEADYDNNNPVIEIDDKGTPVCPPTVNHPDTCKAKVCRSDVDCYDRQVDRVCCYNGCVRTCMIKVKPPPLFDWDETFGEPHQQREDVTNGKIPSGVPAEVAEFQRPTIVLTLPGGCDLTQEQYESYQKFQTSPNIRQCYCLAGDVFCQINGTAPAIPPF